MTIKIVTDSLADIPQDLVQDLDITVVPIYILFGTESFLDGVEISREEFYDRAFNGPVHPRTSQPTPQDFAKAYERLAPKADGILSILISSKLSGTYNSALQAKQAGDYPCPIEVVDSKKLSIAHGLIVIKAARMARDGKSLQEIVTAVNDMIDRVRFLVLFDTLKYLAKGGRIGKAKSLMGSVLNVKPILTLREGEFVPVGQVRNRNKGIDKLVEFVKNAGEIEELSVLHCNTPEDAKNLAERLDPIFPKENILLATVGAGLAGHSGPGVIAVIIMAKK